MNNHFTTNPPSISTPTMELEEQIQYKLDEENYFFNGFIDLETERNRELIGENNGKNKRTIQCF